MAHCANNVSLICIKFNVGTKSWCLYLRFHLHMHMCYVCFTYSSEKADVGGGLCVGSVADNAKQCLLL